MDYLNQHPMLRAAAFTLAGALALLVILRVWGALAARGTSITARRQVGLLQLARWGIILLAGLVLAGEGLVAVGLDRQALVLIGGGLVTAFAFTLRDPLSDFFASAALLAEGIAVVGDEVRVNGEIRGQLVGFGLRSIVISTWTGEVIHVTASGVRTFTNMSKAASRAVVDIDIPASTPVARSTRVLNVACGQVADETFRSRPEVIGVTEQHLDRYVLRITCLVDPASHDGAARLLRGAAADAVAELLVGNADLNTEEMVRIAVSD